MGRRLLLFIQRAQVMRGPRLAAPSSRSRLCLRLRLRKPCKIDAYLT